MSETAQTQESNAPAQAESTGDRKRAPASNFLNIVRGRLPILLVHAVRFDEVLGKMSNKDVAAKLGTSVGKVFDIRKGRNFAYVTKDYKPTEADVADAMKWAEQFGSTNAKGMTAQGDRNVIEAIVKQYKDAGLGSAEDAAKLTEARTANRKPRAPKAVTPAAATGEGGQAQPAGAAEALLS